MKKCKLYPTVRTEKEKGISQDKKSTKVVSGAAIGLGVMAVMLFPGTKSVNASELQPCDSTNTQESVLTASIGQDESVTANIQEDSLSFNEAIEVPTDNTSYDDSVDTPTYDTSNDDSAEASVDSTVSDDLVNAPVDNTISDDFANAPTDNTVDDDSVTTPTDNTADNDSVTIPTDNSGDNDLTTAPTDSTINDDSSNTPSDNIENDGLDDAPTDNTVSNDTSNVPTDSVNDNDLIKPPVENADDHEVTDLQNKDKDNNLSTSPDTIQAPDENVKNLNSFNKTEAEKNEALKQNLLDTAKQFVAEQQSGLTEAQILALYDQYIGGDTSLNDLFVDYTDSFNPDGTLTLDSQNKALNVINFIRALAGLAPVEIKDELNDYAQSGSDYLAENNVNFGTTNPHNAADKSGNEDAIKGLHGSNLFWSSDPNTNMAEAIISFMADNNSEDNYMSVGHRRWLLDPTLKYIGLSSSQGTLGRYISVYIKGSGNQDTGENITWPNSGKFPVELTGGENSPFNVTFGDEYYWNSPDDITITVTRSDGTQITLSFAASDAMIPDNDAWFTLDISSIGNRNRVLIMHLPDSFLNGMKGYTFTFNINGLKDSWGKDNPLSYSVEFFSLKDTMIDKEAAQSVIDKIDGLPDTGSITLENEALINATLDAFNKLTDKQKEHLSPEEVQKLNDAANKLQDLKTALEADKKAAQEVVDVIGSLPDDIRLEDESKIQEAIAAYEKLNATQKTMVSNLSKLENAKNQLNALKEEALANQRAAQAVIDKINAIPNEIILDNKSVIVSIRESYDNLTSDQKSLIDASILNKLTDAEGEIARLEKVEMDTQAAEAVRSLIMELPIASNLELDDETAVNAAREAYDRLTADQKNLLDPTIIQTLSNAEKQIITLKLQAMEDAEAAKVVTDSVNALPKDLSLSDELAVTTVRNMYEALTESQKALLDNSILEKIDYAESVISKLKEELALNQQIAKEMIDRINTIPNNLTLDDEVLVQSVLDAYNALSNAQKSLIDELTISKLNTAIEKISSLKEEAANKEAAQEITNIIDSLPELNDLSVMDEDDVKAARAAFESLTEDQKSYVSNTTLNKLKEAEKQMSALIAQAEHEANQSIANSVADKINALPGIIDLNSKADIEAARNAYNSLSEAQKALVAPEVLTKLNQAEEEVIRLEKIENDKASAKKVNDMITALPDNLTISDSTNVEEAIRSYNALTENQKQLISVEIKEKLFKAQEDMKKVIADYNAQQNQEAADQVVDLINKIPHNVSTGDRNTIEAALKAYDMLTEEQKALIDNQLVIKLVVAESQLRSLEKTENTEKDYSSVIILPENYQNVTYTPQAVKTAEAPTSNPDTGFNERGFFERDKISVFSALTSLLGLLGFSIAYRKKSEKRR